MELLDKLVYKLDATLIKIPKEASTKSEPLILKWVGPYVNVFGHLSNRQPEVVQGKRLLLWSCTWEVQWLNWFRLVYFSRLGCFVLWVAGPYFLLSVVFISILAPLSAESNGGLMQEGTLLMGVSFFLLKTQKVCPQSSLAICHPGLACTGAYAHAHSGPQSLTSINLRSVALSKVWFFQ